MRAVLTASVGRADLLLALRNPCLPPDLLAEQLGFDYRPPAPEPVTVSDRVEPVQSATASAESVVSSGQRTPLQAPSMWVGTPMVRAVPSDVGEASPGALLAPAALDAFLDARAAALPAVPSIWSRHCQALQLADALAATIKGKQVDWSQAAHRMARLQPLLPLPTRRAAAQPPHLALVLDHSPDMAAYCQNAADLMHAYAHWRGADAVACWRWPVASAGPPQPFSDSVALRPWTEHTAVVIISRMGHDQRTRALWSGRLRRLHAAGLHVSVLLPGAAAEAPGHLAHGTRVIPWHEAGTLAASDDDLSRLLEALSVFSRLDEPLVRHCRRQLVPAASPALEHRLWQHPDLEPGYPLRWKPEARARRASALLNAARWPDVALKQLATLVANAHHGLPAAEQAVELLNMAAVVAERRLAVPVDIAAQLQQAERVQSAMADHCLALIRQELSSEGGGTSIHRGVDWYAKRTLDDLTPAARKWHTPVANAWWAGANGPALMAGREVTSDGGVDIQRALALLGKLPSRWKGQTRQVDVVLCGQQVILYVDQPQPLSSDIGRRVGNFTLEGELVQIEWAGTGGTRLLKLPWAGPDEALAPTSVALQGDSAFLFSAVGQHLGVGLMKVMRPAQVAGWWQRGSEVFVDVPSPWGTDHVHKFYPSTAMGEVVAERSGLQPWALLLGVDGFGAYCDLRHGQRLLQRLRYLSPGQFFMGSPEDEGRRDEHPRHPVTLSQGLWLADTPCTQALWQAVMGSNPSHFKDASDAAQRPVENVSWEDVQTFLTRLQALLPEGLMPVLPTEAEWEYACRAGSDMAYAWGEDFDPAKSNVNHGEGALKETSMVKRFAPNAWGLYDLHGNVWEWCADGQRDYGDEAVTDPRGPERPEDWRVLRGGSFNLAPVNARSACRSHDLPGHRFRRFGFRFALRSISPGPGVPGVLGAKAGGRSPTASAEPTPSRKRPRAKRTSGGAA